MAGGKGARIYSPLDLEGVVLQIGRKSFHIKEDSQDYKSLMRYVNIKYQNSQDKDKIIKEFDSLVSKYKTMRESRMSKAKELLERNIFGQKQASKGNVSLHLPANADELMGDIFQKLTTLKLEFDEMEEVPNSMKPLYKQVMKSMEATRKARDETYQLRMMFKKVFK